jgi:ubiquinone/menaquinone biosynthesis C-methylase UbiE
MKATLRGARIVSTLVEAWWDRLRGRLQPRPCPYSLAPVLEVPGRRLVASPRAVLDAFAVVAGEVVVEIGPGTGYYTREILVHLGTSGCLLCLDVQSQMLAETRRRIQGVGLAPWFVQADARALPIRSTSVDCVVLVTVLGEIPDRSRALAEMRRILKPGGRLCVSEQFLDPDFVTSTTLRRELTACGLREVSTSGRMFYTSIWRKVGSEGGLACVE